MRRLPGRGVKTRRTARSAGNGGDPGSGRLTRTDTGAVTGLSCGVRRAVGADGAGHVRADAHVGPAWCGETGDGTKTNRRPEPRAAVGGTAGRSWAVGGTMDQATPLDGATDEETNQCNNFTTLGSGS